ncbi:MAG: HtaA domain-containing protein [Micrococcaceae bacterium]|nr:HtaA domain-containing protein [Micrococcaceae bacterium]
MRIPHVSSRLSKVMLPTALTATLLLAPSNAFATKTSDDDATGTDVCQIENASLQWGVKESFRSYISGTIANGGWETSEGAQYDTPHFTWGDGSGTYDSATGTGEISFSGTVQFSGHDGVLDLTIANPTFVLEGDGTAALLLDTKSSDMEGGVAVDAEQEWVGEITLDQEAIDAGATELTELGTTLTNTGAAAFAGFYEAGEQLDPLTVTFETSDCAADVMTADSQADTSASEAAGNQEPLVIPAPEIPWLAIGLGGFALLVIGFTIGFMVGGRKPKQPRRHAERPQGSRNVDELTGGH